MARLQGYHATAPGRLSKRTSIHLRERLSSRSSRLKSPSHTSSTTCYEHGSKVQIDRYSQQYGALPPHGDPDPTHMPLPSHSSVAVQNSPSSHAVPTGSFALVQSPDTHVSTVHSLPSSQSTSVTHSQPPIGDPAHVPFEHTSDSVHMSASSQDWPSLAGCASQAFVVSLHTPVLH